jgi:hypothetical protein
MLQQGQVFELTSRRSDGERLWAYRYRAGGRDSKDANRLPVGNLADGFVYLAARAAVPLTLSLNLAVERPWDAVGVES